RFPLDGARWRRSLPVYLASVPVYSFLHTSLMALSRSALWALLGMGAYDYGRFPTRYFMEFPNDILSAATLLGVLTVIRYARVFREREVAAAEVRQALTQARLETLQLRLQPHFLFNALNTISSTMYEDPARADAMVGHLGDLLRQSLRTGDAQEVSLGEELALLGSYVAIMHERFGERLRIAVEVEPAARAARVPPLLLQPLVENAVRHGGARRRGGRLAVSVRAAREGDALVVRVADDGAGSGTAAGPAGGGGGGGGVGLRATADRLRLLYGDAHAFAAGPLPDGGGFLVAIRLPFRAAEGKASGAEPPAAGVDALAGAAARAR
ncbi:MAG TPA: histidine kinase, partial [Gemmatimonadaceae bacterium]|nr:histidine kinase [Gemmatimonadaceae bacterium]